MLDVRCQHGIHRLSLASSGYETGTSRPALTESSPSATHHSLIPPQSSVAWHSHKNIVEAVANLPPPASIPHCQQEHPLSPPGKIGVRVQLFPTPNKVNGNYDNSEF